MTVSFYTLVLELETKETNTFIGIPILSSLFHF